MEAEAPQGNNATKHAEIRYRAELRQFVGAYFRFSGWWNAFAAASQLTAVALATLPQFRVWLQPLTNWIVLALAGLAPYMRSLAEEFKRGADDILRRIEISDGTGTVVRVIEVEQVREDASALIGFLAAREPLDLTPYASRMSAGPQRLVDNLRESAWFSGRLARDLARWQRFWAAILILICLGTLYHFATVTVSGVGASASIEARDAAEFAAAVLIFVFFEGSVRRGRDFATFATASHRVFERAELLRRSAGAPTVEDALQLAADYFSARQASPRLSTLWFRWRQRRLNAAWARAERDDSLQTR